MATKHSLEVTKGSSVIDPIPFDTSAATSIDEGEALMPGPFPTEEEWATLPRVAGSIPWTAWTVAFVEFAERFSYYGTSAVCKFTAGFHGRLQKLMLTCIQSSISSRRTCRKALPLVLAS